MSTAGTLYDETKFARVMTVATAASSASLIFTAGLDDTNFDNYFFEIDNIILSLADVQLFMLLSANSGSTWVSNYYYGWLSIFTALPTTNQVFYGNRSVGSQYIPNICLTHGMPSGNAVTGRVRVFNGPDVSGTQRQVTFQTASWTSGASYGHTIIQGGGSELNNSSRINGVKFQASSGNLYTGSIRMYGMHKP